MRSASVTEAVDSSSPDAGRPLLSVSAVRFSYGRGGLALDGPSLTLGPGEIVGLLGPNGSGKTTLLRMLASGTPPDAGKIEWFSGADRSGLVASVFDRIPSPSGLSGRRRTVGLTRLRGVARREAERRAGDWLDRFGLSQRADDPVDAYSHGMRRRVGLATGFAASATVLLLDEPGIGLDPEGRTALESALEERRAGGGGTLLATNDTSLAARICDRVALLHHGRVVADGSPSDLVRRVGRSTVFELETDGAVPGDPPSGMHEIGRTERSLRLAAPAGSRELPRVCAWLLEGGTVIRAVRVREPGLADLFFELTGAALREPNETATE